MTGRTPPSTERKLFKQKQAVNDKDFKIKHDLKNFRSLRESQSSVCNFFAPATFFNCDLLLNRRTATWHLFVKWTLTFTSIVSAGLTVRAPEAWDLEALADGGDSADMT